ncbi:MAG: hypothetical protein Q9222_001843 [Ikaeria aurantiellina]
MASLLGASLQLVEQDISAQLPAFSGSSQKVLALSLHVRLAKTTTIILKTVYGEEGRMDRKCLNSIKNALKCLAGANDERNISFPLGLENFFGSYGETLILRRDCDFFKPKSFIPFDLETTWSCAVLLLVAKRVDPSLLKGEPWLQKIYLILYKMVLRGNLIAGLRKAELQQLDEAPARLHSPSTNPMPSYDHVVGGNFDSDPRSGDSARDADSNHSQMQFEPLHDWNSDEGFTGERLIAFADSLDFTTLDWLSAAPLDQLEGCLD